ncbi:MAG: hypothetical protein AABY26_03925 [Nanoarchaeota archaeon]
MKKIMVLAVLLASLFLLVSCGGGEQQGAATGAFLGGTQGIEAEFEDFGILEDGISSVFDTEAFPIDVTLKNKGEYKVKPGEVTVVIMGPLLDFSGIPAKELKNKGEVDIISDLLPQGGEETITFASDAKYAKPVNGILELEWFASVESKYQTTLVIPEVCLKEDLADKRVCEVKESKTFYVSGAPITVTSVDEDTSGQAIMAVRIGIKNAGLGQVTKIGETFGNQEKLSFSVDDTKWECKSGGKIDEARLVNEEAEILCKIKEALPKGTLATQQLRLTLDYQYRDQIQKKINVKQSVK